MVSMPIRVQRARSLVMKKERNLVACMHDWLNNKQAGKVKPYIKGEAQRKIGQTK